MHVPDYSNAQENKSSIDIGADLMSRYVWRGMNLSTSAVIQPYIEYSIGGFSLGSWSSYTLAKEPYQEVDLFMTYNFKNISLTVNDYFNPVDSLFTTNNYFNWNKSSTSHAMEAMLSVADIPNLPLTFTAGVFLYGNDRNETNKNYYSTYMELAYDFCISKNDVTVFMGITPFNGMYSDKFNLVNVGLTVSKEIVVSEKFAFPLKGSFIVNPDTENVFFVVGISF